MTKDKVEGTVKRTVVLHPIMDNFVRKTWAILIEDGYDATYSMALNFMLLATIMETQREGGLSEETRKTMWDFVNDQKTVNQLNLQEYLGRLRQHWGLS